MAIVSISKAAQLVGKSRTTVQKYIKDGKLSKCAVQNGIEGIDTSELLRVFGSLSGHDVDVHKNEQTVHNFAHKKTDEKNIKIIELEAKIDKVNAVLEEREKTIQAQAKHIESLDNAMRLLEDQRQKMHLIQDSEPKIERPKGFFSRIFKG